MRMRAGAGGADYLRWLLASLRTVSMHLPCGQHACPPLACNIYPATSYPLPTRPPMFWPIPQKPFLTSLLFLSLLLAIATAASVPSFRHDCSDQLHKEIACSVHIVDCDDADGLERTNESTNLPAAAHDIRLEPFARAMPRRSDEKYQLSVDISWQMPPSNSTALLKAFLLEIKPENGAESDRSCFLFNVSDSVWTAQLITSSPRFHFSTESVFEFGASYAVTLQSLPRSDSLENSVSKEVTMPGHPELNRTSSDPAFDCTKYSNPQASKWTAGFRRIFVHSIARTIQIEFVGAPPHYCFEKYEVRLMDETGLDLLHFSEIPVEAMRTEYIGNKSVLFGEYNFTDLEVERDYVPSVIPVERAADGRCLCPLTGNNPFDNRVVCSCIAADWKKVRLHRLERPTAPPMTAELNRTIVETEPHRDNDTFWTVFLLSSSAAILMILLILVYILYVFYRRYRARGKLIRIRFSSKAACSPDVVTPSSFSSTPLIRSARTSVLLVYAHDCAAHDAAVVAFAEYLRDAFHFDVHLDLWDSEEIEHNMLDYVSTSILTADKLMIVNSLGAYCRYKNKIDTKQRIEQAQPGPFDGIFLAQIDQALMHPNIISLRFGYTQNQLVLPPLSFSLQYVLPVNLVQLLSSLCGTDFSSDPRLAVGNPQLAKLNDSITRMTNVIAAEPLWFDRCHRRTPCLPAVEVTAVEDEEVEGPKKKPIISVQSPVKPLIGSHFRHKPRNAVREGRRVPLATAEKNLEEVTLLETAESCADSGLHSDEGISTLEPVCATASLIAAPTPVPPVEVIEKVVEEEPPVKSNGYLNGHIGLLIKDVPSDNVDSGLISDIHNTIDVPS